MKKDFFDTKVGDVCAIIIWVLAKVMSFIVFTVIGNAIYYLMKGAGKLRIRKEKLG